MGVGGWRRVERRVERWVERGGKGGMGVGGDGSVCWGWEEWLWSRQLERFESLGGIYSWMRENGFTLSRRSLCAMMYLSKMVDSDTINTGGLSRVQYDTRTK